MSASMGVASVGPIKTTATGGKRDCDATQHYPMENISINDLVLYFALFAGVIAVIAIVAWVLKGMLSGAGSAAGGLLRGRDRRLGIEETVSIDGRRRLILIRRDDVSHLIMTGGPVDVVIESNIPDPAAAARLQHGNTVASRVEDADTEDS